MKTLLFNILTGIGFLTLLSWSALPNEKTIATGEQPQIAVDTKGIVRLVFGRNDKIFCATSADNGASFSQPVLVAEVPGMHLGMSRGPQLASSSNYTVITAIDKSGNIHWFKLDHSSGKWKTMGTVNDLKGSAPEGLMGLAADLNDHFFAVWLDIRTGQHNQVYFSKLTAKENRWSKNRLVYQSPDGHTCECCKPNVAVKGKEVAVMFRNWLNGSRDLYVLKSVNAGETFSAAQKLGTGTWKLNGCPMDGGGVMVDQSNVIRTDWLRKGQVYYCQPGEPETLIGNGRNCSISGDGASAVIAYQNRDTLKLVTLKNKKTRAIGTGDFMKTAVLPQGHVLCVWEQDSQIKFRSLTL